ncbi:hypothetical protein GCK72_004512 [Caenorhabditis remanei]|uniref:Uncharacterized protein n=1 Tax=Caenorhabditis remanei TaxID=31234 RepID=A0A6A5HDV7_CAERE|nr:hypothetical protein GCK72_004512 [Caenorhabditis remanei]KAF1764563.1 hypothetical protein GCK72_004512 [Caenorhabditis remanei]
MSGGHCLLPMNVIGVFLDHLHRDQIGITDEASGVSDFRGGDGCNELFGTLNGVKDCVRAVEGMLIVVAVDGHFLTAWK